MIRSNEDDEIAKKSEQPPMRVITTAHLVLPEVVCVKNHQKAKQQQRRVSVSIGRVLTSRRGIE